MKCAVKVEDVRACWAEACRCRERFRFAFGATVVVAAINVSIAVVAWPVCLLLCICGRYVYYREMERILGAVPLSEELPTLLDLCVPPANVMPREAQRPFADAILHATSRADERQLAEARARTRIFKDVLGSWVWPEQRELWHAVMVAATQCEVLGFEQEAKRVADGDSSLDDACREAAREYLRRTGAVASEPRDETADAAARAQKAARGALHGFGRRRVAAERELSRLGPAGAEALVAELRSTGRRWRWVRRILDAVAAILGGIMVVSVVLIVDDVTRTYASGNSNEYVQVAILAALLSFPVWFLSRLLLRTRAVGLLIGLADRRTVGLLVDALALEDTRAAGAARSALLRLLPRLAASDAALLTDVHRACLRRVLGGRDIWFIRAILTAYEQVGDEHDIRAVAALAEGRAAARRNEQVRAAAQECLEILRARAQAERPGRMLLRPVTATPDVAAALLRPAGNAAVEQPLVRPVAEAAGDAD